MRFARGPALNDEQNQWNRHDENWRRHGDVADAPSAPGQRITGNQRHYGAAERRPGHRHPQCNAAAIFEPVGDHEGGRQRRRGAHAETKRDVGGQHRGERMRLTGGGESRAGDQRTGQHHQAGPEPIQQPSRKRHREAHRQTHRGLQQRQLGSGPAELLEQRREEDTLGAVAGAADDDQNQEQADDDHPGPPLAGGFQRHSVTRASLGSRATRLAAACGTRSWPGAGNAAAAARPPATQIAPQISMAST